MSENQSSVYTFRVSLPPEGNEEFYNFVERSNDIIREYDAIQQDLFALRLPKVFLGSNKKKLLVLGKRTMQLLSEFSDWNSEARQFCTKPKYLFSHDTENATAFLHFTMDLRERANYVGSSILQGVENYNKRFTEHENRQNFVIAITAWFLTFVGLVVTVLSLLSQ